MGCNSAPASVDLVDKLADVARARERDRAQGTVARRVCGLAELDRGVAGRGEHLAVVAVVQPGMAVRRVIAVPKRRAGHQ